MLNLHQNNLNNLNFLYIIIMANIPEDKKKVKISISIDKESNDRLEKLTIDKKFYKKSRLVDFIIKKYLEENDN